MNNEKIIYYLTGNSLREKENIDILYTEKKNNDCQMHMKSKITKKI